MYYFIYKLLNKDNEIIYIGKTNNIFARINQHYQKKYFKEKEVVDIYFAQCASATDRDIYEIYYINKYNPKYNDKQNFYSAFSYTLPELEFIKYDDNIVITPINKKAIIKNVEFETNNINQNIFLNCSLLEQKILLYFIMTFNPQESRHTMQITDFAMCLNIKNKRIYKDVKETSKRLVEKSIFQTIEEGNGFVTISFTHEYHTLLFMYKKIFTDNELLSLLRVKSIYAIMILIILKTHNQQVITLKQLKKLLGLEDNQYNNFGDFKIRILEKVKKELNEKMNFNFIYKSIKQSNKVDSVKFDIN